MPAKKTIITPALSTWLLTAACGVEPGRETMIEEIGRASCRERV